jgi:spermidine/putrescine transport system permease protein
MTLTAERPATTTAARQTRIAWWHNPWRKPRILLGVVIGYLCWSLLPVLIAVLFSFNAGRSRTSWQGFSTRWYYGDPLRSVWHDQSLHAALFHTFRLGFLTTIITVPLGVLLALGLDRWRGRIPATSSFVVLLSFVLPEALLAVALLFVATTVHLPVFKLGTAGQVIGLVTFQLSYPVIIVRARLMTIGRQYEQAAIDLGATPLGAVRRVLLPMLVPAILASTVLVFADVIDDFVIVRYLSSDASTEPVSVKIYNTARAAPTPALNALATLLLAAAFLMILLGYLAHRTLNRGNQAAGGIQSFTGDL